MGEREAVDVLVVGAGPTGLSMAAELLRHGASCRLIEQLAEPVVYSKAAVVHARTMEVFDAMGVAEPMQALTRVLHGINVYAGDTRVTHIGFERLADSPYPHVYGISQHDTESVLSQHLARLGGTIERPVKLVALAQDRDGVRANVTRADGSSDEIRARWIVGCDGAHSVVRKALGIGFEGAPYEDRLTQTDVRVSFARKFDDDEILIFLHENGPAAFFPLFRDGRYRVILFEVSAGPPSEPGSPPPPEPTLDDFRRGLEARGVDATLSDPAWSAVFRIHHRHAERLQADRGFLAGDAAHIHSPAGGQGMNTGIQDAFNLAWKLALVAKRRAPASVLESYERERLPVIRALLTATDRMTRGLETAVSLRHPLALALRNQLMSTVTGIGLFQSQALHTLSMLGIAYDKSPLCAQDRAPLWRANVLAGGATEAPSVVDWASFGGGPPPGSRAPDATAEPGSDEGSPVRVHTLLRAGHHVALLFDGASATEAGYRNLVGIAQKLRADYGDAVDPYLVVPFDTVPPSARWEGATLRDANGLLHQRYGARSECVYVIRPDGHVGYRGLPADGAKLTAWFDRTLTRVG